MKARTIKNLRLNIEEAEKGRTWLLLPEGYRQPPAGMKYPLPTLRADLQRLMTITIKSDKRDTGSTYIRRAIKEHHRRSTGRWKDEDLRMEGREHRLARQEERYGQRLKDLGKRATAATNRVVDEARLAAASLKTLFELGKKGLEGQMQAHLKGNEWQGEKISAAAFRGCFGLVRQTVKDIGLPASPEDDLTDTVMDEVAASIEETRGTISLAPGADDDGASH